MKNDYRDTVKEEAIKNCRILYKDIKKPCTETCACWGWEFGKGWNQTVAELSYRLEMLNLMFYKKYGVHVVMEQAKEKFGTLRFYYSVRIDSPLLYRIWHKPFECLHDAIRYNVDFKYKTVVDKPSFEDYEKVEVSDIDEEKEKYKNSSNVKFENIDGKWFRVTKVWHCQSSHQEPTKNRMLYYTMKLLRKIYLFLDFSKEPSSEQVIVREAVESLAEKYVIDAENKCFDVCEGCGTQIGTEYSPRIETDGWISYICEDCDAKRKIEYANGYIEVELKNGKTLSDEEMSKMKRINDEIYSDSYIETETLNEYVKFFEDILSKITISGKNK